MAPTPHPYDDAQREHIRANLQRFERRGIPDPELRRAGVAIVLIPETDGQTCFLLTRRAAGMRRHAGQWALPGGRLDEGENEVEAALREVQEEVGLQVPPENVLGLLDDYRTRSGFAMTPVVVWAGGDAKLVPDPVEVEAIFRVPLSELDRPDVPRTRPIAESDRPVLFTPLLGSHVHAPTAALIYQLKEVAIHGRETRVVDFEQPLFAWS